MLYLRIGLKSNCETHVNLGLFKIGSHCNIIVFSKFSAKVYYHYCYVFYYILLYHCYIIDIHDGFNFIYLNLCYLQIVSYYCKHFYLYI